MSVALALVEGVSAVTDDVRADGHSLAFFAARPDFRGIEEFCTGTQAAVELRHDQAIHFSAARDFEKRRDADVDPADDRFFKLRNKDGVSTGGLDLTETLPHFSHRRGVAKLAAQLRDARNVGCPGASDFERMIFGVHQFKPFSAAGAIVPRHSSAREAHRRRVQDSREGSERFFGVEEDCDRTFIDEFHGHHSLKDSSCDGNAESAERFAEFFVELPGEFRWSSGDKTGPALAARVAIECKLGDDERGTFHVQKRKVHFLLRIFKDAQVCDFFRKRGSDGAGILFADAEQDHQTSSDFAGDFVVYGDTRAADSLEDGTHFTRYMPSLWMALAGLRGSRSGSCATL